jgi:hypothetical protein
MSSNFKSLFNTDSPLQQPKDAEIKVDKEIINSKTNEIKTERLTIELKDDPTRKESANFKEESAQAEEPTKTKIAQAKTKIAQADSKITKAEAENQIFNLSIEDNTEGLVEKFERLAKVYNEFSTFVLTHSLEIEDPETFSKPADISSLFRADYTPPSQ